MKKRMIQTVGLLLLAIIISVGLYFIKKEEYKDWQPVAGVLTDMKQFYKSRGVGGGRSYRLYYTYEVDGITYEGQELFSGNIPDSHYIGEPIEVWYNPETPFKSLYAKPGPGLWPYIPFIFFVPISMFVLSGGFTRKRRSLR